MDIGEIHVHAATFMPSGYAVAVPALARSYLTARVRIDCRTHLNAIRFVLPPNVDAFSATGIRCADEYKTKMAQPDV
jgi:hypothetical protein